MQQRVSILVSDLYGLVHDLAAEVEQAKSTDFPTLLGLMTAATARFLEGWQLEQTAAQGDAQMRSPAVPKLPQIMEAFRQLGEAALFERSSSGEGLEIPVKCEGYRAVLVPGYAYTALDAEPAFLLHLHRTTPRSPGLTPPGPFKTVPIWTGIRGKDLKDIAQALCVSHDLEFSHYYRPNPTCLSSRDPGSQAFDVLLNGAIVGSVVEADSVLGFVRQRLDTKICTRLPWGCTVLTEDVENVDSHPTVYLIEQRGQVEIRRKPTAGQGLTNGGS